jgi:hypothetical protein
MPVNVTITSVTANTPVEIYVCDGLGLNCSYVANVMGFPYTFTVNDPTALSTFTVKIIDVEGCETFVPVGVTPTPTPSFTPESTKTPTPTPSVTKTSTQTPTPTKTPTRTPNSTPSNTPTPSKTVFTFLGRTTPDQLNEVLACSNYITVRSYQSNKPIVNLTIGDFIYDAYPSSPTNGGNLWIALKANGLGPSYAFQIATDGEILDTYTC